MLYRWQQDCALREDRFVRAKPDRPRRRGKRRPGRRTAADGNAAEGSSGPHAGSPAPPAAHGRNYRFGPIPLTMSSRVDRRSYVFGSFGAMRLSSMASRERYSRRKAAQLPAVTARSSAMEAFMMTGRLWSSSLFAQRLMATRSTDMPASAAKVACSSPTPRWRKVAATAAA